MEYKNVGKNFLEKGFPHTPFQKLSNKEKDRGPCRFNEKFAHTLSLCPD